MTKKPEPVSLFELAGHTPAPPPAFEVPKGPGTLPRPAYLAWRAVKVHGELPLLCAAGAADAGKHPTRTCCVTKVLELEHGMDAAAAAKALRTAVAAGWVGEAGGGAFIARSRGDRA